MKHAIYRRRPRALFVAGISLALIAVAGPTSALSMRVADPRNTSASVDVTSIRYRNSEYTFAAVFRVRDLLRTGSAELYVGPPASDFGYVATAWVRADNTIGRRFQYEGDAGRSPARCSGFRASWSAANNYVSLTVPQSCVKIGFQTRAYFQGTMRARGHTDRLAMRLVGRGSSPGCVTRTEFYAARNGMTMSRVHAMWDTVGHFRFTQMGVQNRGYKMCRVSGTNVFAEYAKDHDGTWRMYWKRANAQ